MAQALFDLTAAIRTQVAEWALQPVAGWLYGSTARGDGDRSSDIDLFFVVSNDYDHDQWETQAVELTDRVSRLTGNRVDVLAHSVDSFLALERGRSQFTANLRADGRDLVDSSWRRIAEARTRWAS